jgi:hypothetical protein
VSWGRGDAIPAESEKDDTGREEWDMLLHEYEETCSNRGCKEGVAWRREKFLTAVETKMGEFRETESTLQ